MNTFYFNTGVKYSQYPFLSKGQVLIGNEKAFPFKADMPTGSQFAFLCDNPNLPEADKYTVKPIFETALCSKYAYFYK